MVVVGIVLALISLVGSHGLNIPSCISTFSRSDHSTETEGWNKCHLNGKKNAAYRSTDLSYRRNKKVDENKQKQPSKRGMLKRFIFRRNVKDEDVEIGGGNETKPNRLDAMRLRLAMAMSNINVLPFTKNDWAVACPKTRVGPGQIVPCVVNGLDIIIFASRDGQRLDAFANACPHLGSSFDLATVERRPQVKGKGVADDGSDNGCVDCIVCPVHRTAFEIQSGRVSGEWCPHPPILGGVMGFMKPQNNLIKFAVRLRGKNVEVRIRSRIPNSN